jgi:hypothetical protein
VFNLNVTDTPERGPPLESTTLKMTVDVSLSPVPLRPIVAGVAETNWIDPIAAWAILTVPVALRFAVVPFVPVTVVVAVMGSDPLQPFAVYVAVAVPVIVDTDPAGRIEPTGRAIVARPVPKQVELNATVTGVPEKGVPDWSAMVAVMVAEPPAPIDVGVMSSTPDLKALPLPLPKEYVVVVVVPVVPVPVVPVPVVPVPTNA